MWTILYRIYLNFPGILSLLHWFSILPWHIARYSIILFKTMFSSMMMKKIKMITLKSKVCYYFFFVKSFFTKIFEKKILTKKKLGQAAWIFFLLFFCEIIFRENFLRENDTTISRKNLGVVCLHIQFSNMAIYFLLLQNCTNVVIFWPVFLNWSFIMYFLQKLGLTCSNIMWYFIIIMEILSRQL